MNNNSNNNNSNEERITSAESSIATNPRIAQKSSSSKLFGLLTKRPSKVEPQHNNAMGEQTAITTIAAAQSNQSQSKHDLSFAKCNTPERKARIESAVGNNSKSQTLPPHFTNYAACNNNLEKFQTNSNNCNNSISNSTGSTSLLGINYRKIKPVKSKTHLDRHSAENNAAIQKNDSGADSVNISGQHEVVRRRKSPKKRSPNHNRFSHQFSLCCKAEKKPLTPPVTVRYNSIPDTSNNLLRRDNLSLSWSLVDNASLSVNSSEETSQSQSQSQFNEIIVPTTLIASAATVRKNISLIECASAPQSPVTAKIIFAPLNSHNSPSCSSLKSTQSDAPRNLEIIENSNRSPIRPIAVSACRSRLRLKLYPPGKELPPPLDNKIDSSAVAAIRRATTPQHMSSPNINTEKDFFVPSNQGDNQAVRFMSQENIKMQRRSSGSGLAKHALIAAQVLSLIPTENARERSYLDGRLGSCSLLGPSELNRVLPSRQVTIFVGTWNMNGQSPPKQMNDFVLPSNIEHLPDIVAMGTQESSPDRYEWEVTLQETLGPSHVLFHSTVLGTLHLAILMRRDLIWYCSAPEDASFSVRTGSAFRTKGAVAISFCLFGTSMLFVTSHLTAHQQKVKERVSDVKRIIHALDLPKNLNLRHKSKDVTQNFDNVFWCGDLNFRLGEPREKLLEWIQNTKFPLPSHLPHGYMHTDQLSSVLSDGAAFRGFMEANITFPPTYKYDPGTQYFDTSSKQRAPAYTDRILYKYRQTQGLTFRRQSMIPNALLGNSGANDASNAAVQPYVECLMYDSVPSIVTSDHKPVWALFKTLIRAGTDSIPLAAGLFNRDIYLEGLKRRLNNQYSGSSAVCAIQ